LGEHSGLEGWLEGELRHSSWLGGEPKTVASLGESSEPILKKSQRQLLAWERAQGQHLAWGSVGDSAWVGGELRVSIRREPETVAGLGESP
jgi:hypothetical protein